MMEPVTVTGRIRHIDGQHMGDEITGVMLTIHAPTRPDGLMAERTGTLAVNGDPTFAQRHHGKTLMFFAEGTVIVYEAFDIQVIDSSGTVKLTMVPTIQPV